MALGKEYVDLVTNAIVQPADRIYSFTKFVAALLGSVVLFAFIVLYFFPTRTKQLFAWPIAPPMTAMFIGASYVNGVIFFRAVLFHLGIPIWLQHVLPFIITPIAYQLGYRAVYQRFSGEERSCY